MKYLSRTIATIPPTDTIDTHYLGTMDLGDRIACKEGNFCGTANATYEGTDTTVATGGLNKYQYRGPIFML